MSDHDQPVAANLLDRQFAAAAPNQQWVSVTTEFVIGSSGPAKALSRRSWICSRGSSWDGPSAR
jgi:transposase InsO family protein